MRKHITAGLILSCMLLSGCSHKKNKKLQEKTYKRISEEAAKKMMDKGNVTIVDVRREDEFADAHIPGAVLIPHESIGTKAPEALPNKETILLIYCHAGVRSIQAADKLVQLGYTNVYEFGGIITWPYEKETV